MKKKYLKFFVIIFYLTSILLGIILTYFNIILTAQGVLLSLTLIIILISIISSILTITLVKSPKKLELNSFQDEMLVLIDIDGWEGQAIKISKDFYEEILKEHVDPKELDEEIRNRLFGINRLKDGIYFLVSKIYERNKDLIYIGETSDFKRRMQEHKNSDNWDRVDHIFNFSNAKRNFGSTIREKVEVILIQMAKKNEDFIIKNIISEKKDTYGILKLYSVKKVVDNIVFIIRHFGLNLT